MKIKNIKPTITGMICIFLLSACSSNKTNIKTTHQSNKLNQVDTILVVSAGEKRSSQSFETRLVRQLSANQVNSRSFHESKESNSDLNEAVVIKTLKELNADAVLVTQLVDLKMNTGINEGRKEIVRTSSNQGIFGVFQQYNFSRIQNPYQVELNASVKISAELYSAQNGELLWSAEVSSDDVEDSDLALIEMSELISSQLANHLR